MSRNLTKTPAFKLELFLEHPKNERLHQTAAFKPQWRIVFLISIVPYPTGKVIEDTGRAVADVKGNYVQGEPVTGKLKLQFTAGEFVPRDSQIFVKLGSQEKVFLLSEVFAEPAQEGVFFAEGVELVGTGKGYGVAGVKTIYPDVSFELHIGKEAKPVDESSSTPTKEVSRGGGGGGERKEDKRAEEKKDDKNESDTIVFRINNR